MEDVVGILMRHSEEGETSERRAGGQMKGLLLKVSSVGNALGWLEWYWGGERGFFRPCPYQLSWGSHFFSSCYSLAARVYIRLVRRPRPQVLATEYPAAKVSKAG